MTNTPERRKHKRCDALISKAAISYDRVIWHDVDIVDISAGGVKISHDTVCAANSTIYLDITIYNSLSEFNLLLNGKIIREETTDELNICVAKFEGINKYSQLQLDELVKSGLSNRNLSFEAAEDGIYSFMFQHKRDFPRNILYSGLSLFSLLGIDSLDCSMLQLCM